MAQTNPPAAPPTFTRHLGRPYTPPAAWHQDGHPCTCDGGGCDFECTEWYTLERPSELSIFANEHCYRSVSGSVLLPVGEMLTGPWCVTLHTLTDAPFYAQGRIARGVMVDGVLYASAFTNSTMCICWDGKEFVATGDATGVNND
jgi:hypothetical protein